MNEIFRPLGRYHFSADLIQVPNGARVGIHPVSVSTVANDVDEAKRRAKELLPTYGEGKMWTFYLERIEELV